MSTAVEHLRKIFQRLDSEPPVVSGYDVNDKRGAFEPLKGHGLFVTAQTARAAPCPECGSGPLRIEYVTDAGTRHRHGYVSCRECGTSEVDLRVRDRFSIDVPSLIRFAFATAGMKYQIEEIVPHRLWRVGKMKLTGRAREIWFGRGVHADSAHQCAAQLASARNAILFVPTERGVAWWKSQTDKLVLSLESTLSWSDGSAAFDHDYAEGALEPANNAKGTRKKPRPKRATRAAQIEALEQELIDHLRAAQDHARFTKDRTRPPQLLPRPRQKELALRIKASETSVSRCFKDPSARELRILWNLAVDINAIMKWSKPSGGKRSP